MRVTRESRFGRGRRVAGGSRPARAALACISRRSVQHESSRDGPDRAGPVDDVRCRDPREPRPGPGPGRRPGPAHAGGELRASSHRHHREPGRAHVRELPPLERGRPRLRRGAEGRQAGRLPGRGMERLAQRQEGRGRSEDAFRLRAERRRRRAGPALGGRCRRPRDGACGEGRPEARRHRPEDQQGREDHSLRHRHGDAGLLHQRRADLAGRQDRLPHRFRRGGRADRGRSRQRHGQAAAVGSSLDHAR